MYLLVIFLRREIFFEIGCGAGFALSGIAKKFPSVRLLGSGIYVVMWDGKTPSPLGEHFSIIFS